MENTKVERIILKKCMAREQFFSIKLVNKNHCEQVGYMYRIHCIEQHKSTAFSFARPLGCVLLFKINHE